MDFPVTALFIAGAAYLLGSVSPAYFAGRARGVDLRFEGRETLDFRNAWTVLGRRVGLLVLIGDALKGQLAIWLAVFLGDSPLALTLAGIAVVAGHIWPIFHGFAGGAGLAPAAGVLLAASPWTLAISVTLFLLFASLIGRAAQAELLAAALIPAVAFLAERGGIARLGLAIGIACLLVGVRWREVEVLVGARKADRGGEGKDN